MIHCCVFHDAVRPAKQLLAGFSSLVGWVVVAFADQIWTPIQAVASVHGYSYVRPEPTAHVKIESALPL